MGQVAGLLILSPARLFEGMYVRARKESELTAGWGIMG
jgi:hypothetical protein